MLPLRGVAAGWPVARRSVSRLGLWWRQIIAELRKVIWPTRKELIAYTTVTLVFAVFMIAFVAQPRLRGQLVGPAGLRLTSQCPTYS